MTKLLFNIERFSFSNAGDRIIVSTNKNCHSIDKAKFQKWVDRDEKRVGRTWDELDAFGDIKTGIDDIVQQYDY